MSVLVAEIGAPVCHHCGYSLAGLALEGRCPECGERYVAGAGPVWLDGRCVPHCNRCGQRLQGLPRKGNCPGCGEWYTCSRVVMAPAFRRRGDALRERVVKLLGALRPSLRTAAIVLLIAGNAAVLVGLGWYAWREFLKVMGP